MLSNAIFTEDNNDNHSNNHNDDNDDNDSASEDDTDDDSMNEEVNEENEEEHNDDDDDDDDDGEKSCMIRQINNYFKRIGESKSFEEQINLSEKEINPLDDWWHQSYDDDDKELNLKIFKLKSASILKDLDEKLLEKIFGHTFVILANKVINTTNKEENQIIIKDIKKNMDILYETDNFNNHITQPVDKCINLIDSAKLILRFNEKIQLAGD